MLPCDPTQVLAAVVLMNEVREVPEKVKHKTHDYKIVQEGQLRLLCCSPTIYLVLTTLCFVTVGTRQQPFARARKHGSRSALCG